VNGNHRLKAAKELNILQLPCVVYDTNNDPYKIGVKCNQDDDSYAPMDLFDWLNVVVALKNNGDTQEKIGERIGWTRDKVQKYSEISNSIVTENLNLAKSVQVGRVTENVTNVTIDFTEGWFREILKLSPDNQKVCIQEYIDSKGKLKGKLLSDKVGRLKLYEDMVTYVHENIVDNSIDKDEIIKDIYDELFNTMEQLKTMLIS